MLRTQPARVLGQRLAAGPTLQEHLLYFPSWLARRRARVAWRVRDVLRHPVGLPWLGFHGLRHGFGSLLAAQGVHPRTAMELMRHSQFSLTMQIYTHVAPELARQAMQEIDRALGL